MKRSLFPAVGHSYAGIICIHIYVESKASHLASFMKPRNGFRIRIRFVQVLPVKEIVFLVGKRMN